MTAESLHAAAQGELFARRALKFGGLMALGVCALTLSAKVQIPFHPVPMTMQSAVVLWLGAALGPRLGPVTVAAYVAAGAIGLPVFANPPYGGPAYLLGPTGGYLLGFILAAAWMGWARGRGLIQGFLSAGAVSAVGMATLYILGLVQLGLLTGFTPALWTLGAAPFLLGASVKTALVAAILGLQGGRAR